MEIDNSTDPFDFFGLWLEEARKSELNDPEAMALATVGEGGIPSVRMVLLKNFDRHGFVFYTNMESRKGRELAANPKAALCMHWKSLRRQVRVEGAVDRVPITMADAYFKTRHILSRLGAWASQQSRPLASRADLEGEVKKLEEKYKGQNDIPRPPHWSGYRIIPDRIEFWQEGAFRLHDRFEFRPDPENAGKWRVQRLYP